MSNIHRVADRIRFLLLLVSVALLLGTVLRVLGETAMKITVKPFLPQCCIQFVFGDVHVGRVNVGFIGTMSSEFCILLLAIGSEDSFATTLTDLGFHLVREVI